MSTTRTSPACCLPGSIHSPGLAAWNVAVATGAHRRRPATSPVEASTPLGTSQATTARRARPPRRSPRSRARRPARRARRSRCRASRRRSRPPPASAAGRTAAAARPAAARSCARASPLQLVARREQRARDLAAGVAQQPRGDEAVAAVVALAADDRDRPRRRDARAHDAARGPAPARSISSSDGIAALARSPSGRRARMRGRVEQRRPASRAALTLSDDRHRRRVAPRCGSARSRTSARRARWARAADGAVQQHARRAVAVADDLDLGKLQRLQRQRLRDRLLRAEARGQVLRRARARRPRRRARRR